MAGRLIDLGETHGASQRIVSANDHVFGEESGFGKRISGGFTARQILTETETDYKVHLEPAITAGGKAIPDTFAVCKPDGTPFARTVGKQFEPVQNAELAAFAESLGLRFQAGGYLQDGAVVWYHALLPDSAKAVRETELGQDKEAAGVWVITAHNGTVSTIAKYGAWRFFCNNQVEGILSQKVPTQITLRKTRSVHERLQQAQRTMGMALHAHGAHVQEMMELERREMRLKEMQTFSEQLIGETQEAIEESARTISKRTQGFRSARIDRLCHLFQHGKGNVGRTRYDAFSAVTELDDHHVSRLSPMARFQAMALPPQDSIKRKALRLLLK